MEYLDSFEDFTYNMKIFEKFTSVDLFQILMEIEHESGYDTIDE